MTQTMDSVATRPLTLLNDLVKTRISRAIFNNEIPDPRDVIIICLINTCDVLRFIFELDEESEKRVEFICKMDLIGRSIADAVGHNLAGPLFRRSALAKSIPVVPLRQLLRSKHVRDGNIPALFAALAETHGPVFEIRPPFVERMTFWPDPRQITGCIGTGACTSEPGTIWRTSRKSMAGRDYCLPWMVPTILDIASPRNRDIPARGWKASWMSSTHMRGST